VTPDEYSVVLDKIERSTLPQRYREQARQLRLRVVDELGRVDDEIKAMAADFASKADYEDPTTDLFKVVPLRIVRRYMAGAAWAAVDDRAFVAAAVASGDPIAFVRQEIVPGTIVFPPEHSWMVDAPSVTGMTSRELKTALELRPDHNPPYVLFRLTRARMLAAGVRVRQPNALDAAAAGHPQWNPAGLRLGQEYLDRAVPIEAVEELLWKP
jgi:hypothetical protein